MDVLIPNYSAQKALAIDFAVTCPLQSKYLTDSALTSGYACNSDAFEINLIVLKSKFKNKIWNAFQYNDKQYKFKMLRTMCALYKLYLKSNLKQKGKKAISNILC